MVCVHTLLYLTLGIHISNIFSADLVTTVWFAGINVHHYNANRLLTASTVARFGRFQIF